ncbi:hypothetical protein [Novosphingobium clariflavum]|uniref:Uncharacterized protein n=1 Tax=Novosphingobium clariflavum TaxID=2029884 RepID=A0ABV6S1X7_9SPHN|nr:hypothetical protein [Novosphingobium clariflavum]
MPRIALTASQAARNSQQIVYAAAQKLAAETAKVAEQTQAVMDLTIGLDVDGINTSINDIRDRLDNLETP